MAQAQRIPAAGPLLAGRLSIASWKSLLALALVLGAFGVLSYLLWVGSFWGYRAFFGADAQPRAILGVRHAVVISLLIGFTVASRLYWWTRLHETIAALAPLLPAGARPPDPRGARELRSRRGWAAQAIGAAIGLAVVAASFEGPESFREQWDAHSFWATAANLLLFAWMGRLVFEQYAADRLLTRTVTSRVRVPLLSPEALAPYARLGLANALFWFLGSSIASLLVLNWGFSWTLAIVLTGTFAIGTFSLLAPARQIHARMQQAKAAELAVVRSAIEAERQPGVIGADPLASARLPGLLAWEARVMAVPAWPFDLSVWLRFALLAAVALGSWLGSALVERLLDLAFA